MVFDEYVYLDTYQAENELDMIEEMGNMLDEEVVRERIQKILKSIETARAKLDELESRCRIAFSRALRTKASTKEIMIEYSEMERETKIKLIPERDAVIVAISKLPSASEKIRVKAEEIIRKYNLTERDVERLYVYYLGE